MATLNEEQKNLVYIKGDVYADGWSNPFFLERYLLFQESVLGHYSSSVRMHKFAYEEMASPCTCMAEALHWFYDQYLSRRNVLKWFIEAN